ncbi:hypothetical protein [Pseudomonas sp. 8Z]|uniref:hypothetical protein n=1 Tax=Pseudomonas sp. 8Z TaxID=2653166 RepID=UPI0013598335|nr:hypothetical protein [Pseudomonas sp. 8Z]
MDVYKVRVDDTSATKITAANFERDTLKRPPYYQAGTAGGEPSHFAVCPACDNPIQIIGLYKKLAHTPNPYGRHHSRSVANLAEYDQDSYDFCPYSNPDREPDRTARRTRAEGLPEKILSLLIENFDSVIYMIEQSIGIKIGDALAKRMLLSYRDEQGHMYKAATLLNIPWIFAYMANAKSIARQRVFNNPELLINLSSALPNAAIDQEGKQEGVLKPANDKDYLDVNVSFIHHRIVQTGSTINETMKMIVFTHRGKQVITIHEQLIPFATDHFLALINVPLERAYRPRQGTLVPLARQILQP